MTTSSITDPRGIANRFGVGSNTPAFARTPILQPGTALPDGVTYLPSGRATSLWGRLPARDDAPVLTIEPGATVVVDTVSHEGLLPDQGQDPTRFFGAHGVQADAVLLDAIEIARDSARDAAQDGPHVVTGPIEIEGALPGDLLRITVVKLEPRVPYGVVSNRHGKGALPGVLPRSGTTVSVFTPVEERDGTLVGTMPLTEGGERHVAFPLAPFLGTMGVAPAEGGRLHSVPPGPHGGNIDIKLLTEGSVLYLPVQVAGALAYVGDPHFAQGDGEVALTALEASLRATLTFDLVPAADAREAFGELTGPLVRTPDYLVPTGLDPDLNVAMRNCVRASLDLLHARWGMDEHLAYAYLSAAADFDISQVVDVVCGVHARIREADFADVQSGPGRQTGASA
ncbi:acetamidase/formamidase family protein [Pseudoclavibacter terrae]|uniref:Acetamidase n=1 Tax=Pseudoclavibacter terrae TaxID=1530195 RepID=A0A7J5AYT8_9MICO|nr:acetamidase/formamidase family protein [Pseudoclavibacter terrae]KAB1636720.1 acetamidase [Pseudoclavibacter terrae]